MTSRALREFQGYFWLPNAPDNKIPGRCFATDHGIRLSVLGTFSGEPFESPGAEIPRILGVSAIGQDVTLENCFFVTRNVRFPGLPQSTIHVHLLLAGHHFAEGESIEFDEVTCQSEAFDEWLRFGVIEGSWDPASRSTAITFFPPQTREWSLANGIQLQLSTSWTGPSQREYRESCIRKQTWVGFRSSQPSPLGDLLKIVTRFSNFVSFVVDQTTSPQAIQAYSGRVTNEIRGQAQKVPVDVYFEPVTNDTPDVSRISIDALFPFNQVDERFGNVLSHWFINHDKFESSFNLYFGTRSGRDIYLENRFLMLVQALEAMHRKSSSDTAFSAESYSKFRKMLEDVAPEEYKEWVQIRLRYGNELSLRQRLRVLFGDFESFFGGSERIKNFIDRITNARNYFTHYDAALSHVASDMKDISKLCVVLEALLKMQMAKLCGFSSEEVIGFCNSSSSFGGRLATILA